MGTACINGNCTDPCIGFDECGANAVCETVSHSATCKCPSGTRELNSPYVACVPAEMDLSTISCLRDSDCSFGLTCQEWQCRPASNRRKRKLKRWSTHPPWPLILQCCETKQTMNYTKNDKNLLICSSAERCDSYCWKVGLLLFRVLFCTFCIIFLWNGCTAI